MYLRLILLILEREKLMCVHRYWLIHRADYQKILYDAAIKAGVHFSLGCHVEGVDEKETTLILKDGQRLQADLIIGADGIRSKIRKTILKDRDPGPVDSSNCAYRATVPAEVMNSDPELAKFMSDPNGNLWTGPGGHVMAYPIKNGTLYNLVMSHPGKAAVGKWNEPGDVGEMRKMHERWDPVLQKILRNVESCLKWKLAYLPPLETWVGESGKVVIIGDAAHGMLPYVSLILSSRRGFSNDLEQMAQGAAVSIEDAAALAEAVSQAESTEDLPYLLHAFEKVRKSRCEGISKATHDNAHIWHLPDGPEQEQRDRASKAKMQRTLEKDRNGEGSESRRSSMGKFIDQAAMPDLYGYDAVKEVSSP